MESFYSLIYYKTNPLTDEMFAIAILAGGGEGPFMYVSKARMAALKKIMSHNSFLSLKRHLRTLLDKVESSRKEAAGILLFDPVFSLSQLEDLAKHSKEAIVYSQPITINEWMDADFFTKFSEEFLGEKISE